MRAALAGALARVERLQDRGIGGVAGGDVADGDADARRSPPASVDGDEAALALDEQVVGLVIAVGTVLAVAGDRAIDQPGNRAW